MDLKFLSEDIKNVMHFKSATLEYDRTECDHTPEIFTEGEGAKVPTLQRSVGRLCRGFTLSVYGQSGSTSNDRTSIHSLQFNGGDTAFPLLQRKTHTFTFV
jgi:hypothetical protein